MSSTHDHNAEAAPIIPNPLGIHCVDCAPFSPCGSCLAQILAEEAFAHGRYEDM
jgi:hypothetical protein